MTKEAQIQGTLAAFADMGIIKVASEQDFANFVYQVSDYVGEDSSINKIAEAVQTLVYDANDVFKKQASEDARLKDYKEALGELVMMKTAGKIADDVFVNVSSRLLKEAFSGMPPQALQNMGQYAASMDAKAKATAPKPQPKPEVKQPATAAKAPLKKSSCGKSASCGKKA